MIGLERGTVRVVDHRTEWSPLFESEAARLRSALGDRLVGVEHVGSTAVKGLAAKPVIDMLAIVESSEDAEAVVEILEDMDYERRESDGVEDRIFLAKGPEYGRTHYLSVTVEGSDTHREQVAFRDYLRDNPDVAREYERLKRELASDHPDNRQAYTARKSRFIRDVLDEIREQQP